MGRLPDQLMHLCGGNVAAHQFYVYELGSGRTRATNLEKYSALAEQCVDGCRCLCDSNAQHTNAERLFSCSSISEKKKQTQTWENKKQTQIKSWSLFHRDLGELLRREAYKHRTAPKSDAWFKNVNDAFLFSWGL